MATSFAQPVSHPRGHHWFQVMGTCGSVELADLQMNDVADVDWGFTPVDLPEAWRASGHDGLDMFVHHHFREAVLRGAPLDLDVYQAMDTAAPAILAAESIALGSKPMPVPDFRPGADRRRRARPAGA